MWYSVNSSYIYFQQQPQYVMDYYLYIFSIIKDILSYKNYNINIILGNINVPNINNNNLIKVGINYEHTLVRIGGRDTRNSIIGKIKDDDNRNYLVRIDNFNNLNDSNIIIDYSIPNIHNISLVDSLNNFAKKMIYIAPKLYELNINSNNRTIETLTTFINTNEPRRYKLLELLKNNKIIHTNINNCFNKKKLQELYKKTKILINIHQTEHHHTLEELRILPALLNGVIVISEFSPLTELVPYSKFIIWTKYDNIIDTIINVINNYETFYNKIFNDNINILEKLHDINYNNLKDKIDNL
jgi:hypothetical protein